MKYEIQPDEPISMAVVRAVSEQQNQDELSLSPLGEVIDTDCLECLFNPHQTGLSPSDSQLSFTYLDSHVTIVKGEYIQIEPVPTKIG